MLPFLLEQIIKVAVQHSPDKAESMRSITECKRAGSAATASHYLPDSALPPSPLKYLKLFLENSQGFLMSLISNAWLDIHFQVTIAPYKVGGELPVFGTFFIRVQGLLKAMREEGSRTQPVLPFCLS